MEQSDKMKKKDIKQAYLVWNIVIQFFLESFAGIFIGYFLGKKLDEWIFGDKEIFVYIIMILGMFSALVSLILKALKLSRSDSSGKET